MTTNAPTPDPLVKDIAGKGERIACGACLHSDDAMCVRGPKPFKQSYERFYDDSDFCGPDARFFVRRTLLNRLRTHLLSGGSDE